jgi:hypothetical protein
MRLCDALQFIDCKTVEDAMEGERLGCAPGQGCVVAETNNQWGIVCLRPIAVAPKFSRFGKVAAEGNHLEIARTMLSPRERASRELPMSRREERGLFRRQAEDGVCQGRIIAWCRGADLCFASGDEAGAFAWIWMTCTARFLAAGLCVLVDGLVDWRGCGSGLGIG